MINLKKFFRHTVKGRVRSFQREGFNLDSHLLDRLNHGFLSVYHESVVFCTVNVCYWDGFIGGVCQIAHHRLMAMMLENTGGLTSMVGCQVIIENVLWPYHVHPLVVVVYDPPVEGSPV